MDLGQHARRKGWVGSQSKLLADPWQHVSIGVPLTFPLHPDPDVQVVGNRILQFWSPQHWGLPCAAKSWLTSIMPTTTSGANRNA